MTKWSMARVVVAVSVLVVVASTIALLLSRPPLYVATLAVGLVTVHSFVAIAWYAGRHVRRRYTATVGFAESIVGAAIFWLAPLFHGRFAPPGESLLPDWAIWGLAGYGIAGLLTITAAMMSPGRDGRQLNVS